MLAVFGLYALLPLIALSAMPVEQNAGWKIWLARGTDSAGNTYEELPASTTSAS